jgi:hypothetical protein
MRVERIVIGGLVVLSAGACARQRVGNGSTAALVTPAVYEFTGGAAGEAASGTIAISRDGT